MSTPFQLRSYQQAILDKIAQSSTIVLLPTGAGKTVIPAEIIRRDQKKTLFLVPTCNLVQQQGEFLRTWTGQNVGEYFGGERLPESFDILVSTPKAFQISQGKRSALLGWDSFELVVFDEVHHVLKEHPYRKLALSISRWNDRNFGETQGAPKKLQVIGLTASLSYAVSEREIQRSIQNLMREMQMEQLCTATREELIAGGYHANTSAPVVVGQAQSIDLLAEFGRVDPSLHPVADRKPHLLLPTFWHRVKTGCCSPFASALLEQIRAREGILRHEMSDFQGPLETVKKLADWGMMAHKAAAKLGQGSVAKDLCVELEQWYEALRILVASWEEGKESAILFLRMMLSDHAQRQSAAFFEQNDSDDMYVRLEQLKEVLLAEHNDEFRGIVFVQQRVTTHIVDYFLQQDEDLRGKFRTAPLYAVTSPATASLAISKQQSNDSLSKFRTGELNLLIATVVAEEGLDVPAANCVIRYDPVLNAVSHVQGRGRARQSDSSFIVLQERPDRPTSVLQDVEQRQIEVASNFRPKSEMTAAESEQLRRKEVQAQEARERGAADVLGRGGESGAVADLNLYCKKTKVELNETFEGEECVLRYRSVLRDVIGRGRSPQKKAAKRLAAWDLVRRLKEGEGAFGRA